MALAVTGPAVATWLIFGTSAEMASMQQVTAIRFETQWACERARLTANPTNLHAGTIFSIPPHCVKDMPSWWIKPEPKRGWPMSRSGR